MAYTGVSIVDYLNSTGQNSSFANRQAIAKANGISNYTGSAEQNNTLLAYLNKPQSPAPTTVKTTPAPIVTTPTVTNKPTTTTAPVSTTNNNGVTTTKSAPADSSGLKADATTVADAYKKFNANAGDLQNSIEASAKYQAEQLAKKSKTPIDEEAVRRSFVARMQGSIDAINNTYATILANAKVQSANNAGIGRAVNARSGLLGSDFGNASDANIATANNNNENAVENERLGKIAMILADANKSADAEITNRRAEQDKASKDLMDNLLTRETRTAGTASKLAKALLAQGFKGINELSPDDVKKIEADYGVDLATLTSAFSNEVASNKKAEADMALTNAKTATELDANRYKTIGDGAQLYDTKTGKIVENTKTFSPNQGGGGTSTGASGGVYVVGANPVVDAYVARAKAQGNMTGIPKQYQNAVTLAMYSDKAGNTVSQEDSIKAKAQYDGVMEAIANARKLADSAGPSGIGKFFGNTFQGGQYGNNKLKNYTDTIKTNILTGFTDPSIKKFFGPSMSNADVQLMMSKGTSLNAENMDPESYKAELNRVEKVLKTLQPVSSVSNSTGGSSAVDTSPVSQVMVQGVLYNVDANGDMTPAE